MRKPNIPTAFNFELMGWETVFYWNLARWKIFLVQSCRDKVVTNVAAKVKFSWGKDKENASPFLALLAELVP